MWSVGAIPAGIVLPNRRSTTVFGLDWQTTVTVLIVVIAFLSILRRCGRVLGVTRPTSSCCDGCSANDRADGQTAIKVRALVNLDGISDQDGS